MKTFATSLVLFLLTLCLVIGLVACGTPQNNEPETTPNPETTDPNNGQQKEDLGDFYYYNLMESVCTSNRVAVKLNNLVYEVETDDQTPNGIQKVTSVDVAELEIYVEDGKLGGAAHGKVNMTFFDAVAGYADYSAVIDGDYIYLVIEGQSNGEDQKVQYKYAISELIGNVIDLDSSEEILPVIEDTVLPMLGELVEENKVAIDKVLENVIDIFFDVQKQADGSVVISLSKAKILTLNETLATKPMAEVLDTYFGKNSFDALVNKAYEILDLKVSEIPAYLKDNGIDYDTLVEKVEEFLPTIGAPEDFDIDELLTNSDYSDYAIGMLLLGVEDDSYKTQIEENVISTLRTNTLYDALGYDAEFKAEVENIINEVFNYVTFSITTNASGELSAVHVELNKVPVGGSSMSDSEHDHNHTTTVPGNIVTPVTPITYTYYLSFSLDVIANGDITVTWDDIVDEMNNAIVPIPDDMKDEIGFSCSSHDHSYHDTICFQGEEYNTICYYGWTEIADFDTVYQTSITSNCGDWLCYDLDVPQKEYSYEVHFVETDSETLIFLYSYYNDSVAKIEQVSGGFNVTYENGETEYIIMAAGEETMMTLIAKLFPLVFEVKYEIYRGYVTYYYNTTTKEFALESQHVFEETKNALGTTCLDGYEIVQTCNGCGASYTEGPYYDHEETTMHMINLSEYDICFGSVYYTYCEKCGLTPYVLNFYYYCNTELLYTDITTNTYECRDCHMRYVVNENWMILIKDGVEIDLTPNNSFVDQITVE